MLDKTKDKWLRKCLRDLEKLAHKRREAVISDNQGMFMSPQERYAAKILEKETTMIYKAIKQAFIIAGIDQIDVSDSLDEQDIFINTIQPEQIDQFQLEAFTVRKALLREIGNRVKIQPRPRGNPLKGGLVKKLIAQGYNLYQANIEADRLMQLGEKTAFVPRPVEKLEASPDEVAKAIEMIEQSRKIRDGGKDDMTIEQLNRAMMGEMSDADFDSSDNLNPIPPPEPKVKTKSQDEIIAAIKKAQKSPQLFKSTVFSRMSAQIARDAKKE